MSAVLAVGRTKRVHARSYSMILMHRNMSYCGAKNKFHINSKMQFLAAQFTQSNRISVGRQAQGLGFGGTDFIAILAADERSSFAGSASSFIWAWTNSVCSRMNSWASLACT